MMLTRENGECKYLQIALKTLPFVKIKVAMWQVDVVVAGDILQFVI